MQKLSRKTKELVEATLMIGISRSTGELNSSYDSRREQIKNSIDGILNQHIKMTKEICVDFIAWHSCTVGSEYMSYEDAFDAFEKQYKDNHF